MGDKFVQGSPAAVEFAPEAQTLRRIDLGLSTPWQEPRTETQIRLAAIWRRVLGIDAIGVFDDFFELGGNSFAATALAAEIEATFDLRFAPSDIINLTTVTKQAEMVDAEAADLAPQLPAHLILSRTGGSQPPAFIVHGGLGFIFFKPEFLDEVGQDRPVYLFQAPGLDGSAASLGTIEEIASLYVDSLRRVQAAGPYNLVAMCAGSFIALEMCNQLVEVGESVAHLVLLDPPTAPPAIKDDLAEQTGRAERSTASTRILRSLNFLGRDKSERAGARALRRQEKVRRIRDTAETVLEEVDWILSEQRPYSDEALARVAEQLRLALNAHVPRPFGGKAAILMNSTKAQKILGDSAFWRSYLGGIEHQVCGNNHHEVFRDRIMETARFVTQSLK